MIVEVVAVGTELLLGQIVNGNGAYLGRKLAEAGLDANHQTVVGDNLERLAEVIRVALGRADAVVLTGGIGPTPDDLTREAICAATGREMVFDPDYAEVLRARWAAFGRPMPENNLRQAEHPQGSALLPNPKGTAPGIALQHDGSWIYAVPGVPAEMELMVETQVLPALRRAAGIDQSIVSRVIRTWGRSESQVAELLGDLYEASVNPSLAFLASNAEIKVRITAKGDTEAEALRLVAPLEQQVRERLGAAVFGTDDETVEGVVLGLLAERGWWLATAESATAGLVAARLGAVAGASRVFRGGVIAYDRVVKITQLGVPAALLDEHGAVSEAAALAMAAGAAAALEAEVAVAVTGSAGPEPLEREVGTMVVAVQTPEGARARTMRLPGDRERVRAYTSTAALHLVRLAVDGSWWSE